MAFRDLREFIAKLEEIGELQRIQAPVSAELEISEITDRVCKGPAAHNKALLFEHVKGSNIPVLTNALGSARRMALALGVDDLDQLTANLGVLIKPELPKGLGQMMNRAGDYWDALKSIGLGPAIVKKAPVQEVVLLGSDADLNRLPIMQCWPQDGGRFITMTTVISRDPVKGIRNVGMYRCQVHDSHTLGMHWQLHKGGAEHERKAQQAGIDRIPVAISLGGDPAVMWSGSAPLPPDIDEFLLAGWLRGKPVDLVRCVSQPLEVPAQAEIVIEGYVDPSESRLEGPFGDHTGFYTPPAPYPVLHITAVTHRRQPIYPTTIVGKPPMEDYWMGKATERLFLPLMKLFQGEIVDVNMPAAGVFHNLIFVSIKKRFPGHARKVINGLWGLGLMMLTKCIVIFDAEVDVQNEAEALFHMFGNVDWGRDVIIQDGPVDALDHGSHHFAFGGKIGIDATHKLPEEGYTRGWPTPIAMSDEIKERVGRRWLQYGFGAAPG
ncbi:MAG: menaquinone biosynthesis decarboxylase [Caldilineales bacterium]|nr:menaquinone biosynthesis decarboxylase [Caldilineales bacterium]